MVKVIKEKTPTGPHDDRWHYLDLEDKAHSQNYFEWKYFNFVQKDLEGYVIYFILDPEKKSKLSGGRLLLRILKDGKSYGFLKKIPVDKINFDTLSASVLMDSAKIVEHDSYHYNLDCNLPEMSWNLNYKQDVPSIESFENANFGLMRWERANWLVKMPKANVKGEIKIGEETFHIDGFGYSDTNWGKFMPFFSKYEWGQYNNESLSLVFGAIYKLGKLKNSYFYFVMDKHLVSLENKKCKIEHLEWVNDKEAGLKIPSKSIFSAENEDYEIKFSSELIRADSPGIMINPFLPKVVISEQIVRYDGFIKHKGEIICEFKGKGFQEWSGKTWKKVVVPF